MTATDAGIRALREAGHPRVTLYMPDKYAIAGEFFRWEYAIAVAGKILEINPFDEPNVTESKENTARLLKYYEEHGASARDRESPDREEWRFSTPTRRCCTP